MQRIIRNRASGLFFSQNGQWTPDPSQAQTFQSTQELIRAALKLGESELEEMLILGEVPSGLDVLLPLGVISPPRW